MHSRMDALQTMPPVNLRRLANKFHSVAKQASFQTLFFRVPGRFWSDLGGSGRPKWSRKSKILLLFCYTFFDYVFGAIFHRVFEGRTLKIINFTKEKPRFSLNRRFRKSIENTSIWESFSEAKTMKNREKMVLKTMCFFDIDFSSLFFDFS